MKKSRFEKRTLLHGPLLPADGLEVSQSLDVVIVGEAVAARPRGRRVVALDGLE